ncbi:hypothetical protein J5226_10240 [Lysobacter sp. K5869]|uniref:hypothetical protein n=1 Tax=Lysobacter sp. K5869 TaxID=2820808 RepID=UPI001C063F15|nr:hypothetical protein [Lysobacter sp. K5869]QWP78743.1 hypothetical protein J5226_10240 [Lysobacter sp. K5869]
MSAIAPIAPRRLAIAPLLLALAACAFAPAALAQQKIEQQMSAEQFKNAGLNKLNDQELSNLNAWLNRTLDAETTKAVDKAKGESAQERRGFFDKSPAKEPIVARMNGHFDGFSRGQTFVLDNGQEWRQDDSADLPGVSLESPQVRITPSIIGNAWYLSVQGYNTRAKVVRVK